MTEAEVVDSSSAAAAAEEECTQRYSGARVRVLVDSPNLVTQREALAIFGAVWCRCS